MESEEKSKNSLGGIGGSKEMCTTPPHPNLSFAWFSKHIATISLASSMQPATSHRRILTLMRPSRGRLWLNDLWAFCYTKCCWPFVVGALFSSLCNLLLFAASFLNAWIFHLPQESEKVNKIPLVLGYFQQQKKRSVRGIFFAVAHVFTFRWHKLTRSLSRIFMSKSLVHFVQLCASCCQYCSRDAILMSNSSDGKKISGIKKQNSTC